MHVINGFYTVNRFNRKPVFSDSLVVHLLLKFPKHNFLSIIWLFFALNFNSCLPLTNK